MEPTGSIDRTREGIVIEWSGGESILYSYELLWELRERGHTLLQPEDEDENE